MLWLALAAALVSPPVTGLKPIALHSGVNVIQALGPDGRDGVIVVGAPGVETADQSHTDYFTLLRDVGGGRGWTVVRTLGRLRPDGSTDEAATDLVSDYPHTGEDQVSSVRFARARVSGRRATLMIRAQRDFALPIPAPSRVTVDVYRLQVDDAFGDASFRRIRRSRSAACFDNTDAALKVIMGLPTPAGFSGAATSKPCP